MKKLPIGISTLEKIIEGDYLYIDKTDIALDLIDNGGGYYFLSRPRRFGKSLFLDTLRSIFEAQKELFEGLYIYDKYAFVEYPVIHISFGSGRVYDKQELHDKLFNLLGSNQKYLDIVCQEQKYPSFCFTELIEKAYEKYNQKVIILIDEYDKPILDNIENREIAKDMREELKNFYSVIKDSDRYLKFVFITGVSKF
ncbi:MAG: AAA family ATPase, partial [Campylobacterota bacterium]|nr:AAA family ATPase [Campylobacterota bacterium]